MKNKNVYLNGERLKPNKVQAGKFAGGITRPKGWKPPKQCRCSATSPDECQCGAWDEPKMQTRPMSEHEEMMFEELLTLREEKRIWMNSIDSKSLSSKSKPAKQEPYVTIVELTKICLRVQRTHNFTEFDEVHNHAVASVLACAKEAASVVARKRAKK